MKVSGFTIARNVLNADYPIKEAVFSILPLVDEMIIAVGKSDDETLNYIKSFDSNKIKIVETVWDLSLRKGGKVLADETNKALAAVAKDSDWLFYIQADECVHEKYHTALKTSMEENLNKKEIEGLLFDYTHFYGSYDYIGDSRKWYKHEIRIIRNNIGAISWGDAQGFRKPSGEKLKVAQSNASIYHYGWVKHPDLQQAKLMQTSVLWHDDNYVESKIKADTFDYSGIDSLAKFTGTHPSVMNERIEKQNWQFDFDLSKKKFNLKGAVLYWIEKNFGWRVGEYKGYRF